MKSGFLLEGLAMRKMLMAVGLVAAAMWQAGCVTIVKEERRHERRHPPAPVVCEPGADATAEIDAASGLAFPDDMERVYKRIAARRRLSEQSQIQLVNAAFTRLAFPDSKVAVLLAVIHNPCFSPATEKVILDNLGRLAFPDHKRAVLDAIGKRKE